jgi:hypothetical protein
MRLKKMLVALVACMALTAVAANAAQAALHWTVNGGTTLAGPETVTVGTDGPGAGAWLLSGTTLGTTVELTAENVECGTVGGCTIQGAGASTGTLKYTGVTVMKPAGCSAGNPGKTAGSITTAALKDQVKMDKKVAGSTVVFDEFLPSSGTTFVEIEFSGATCTLAEISLPVKGQAEGETGHTVSGVFTPNTTGQEFSPQLLRFGSAQQTTGEGALTLGTGAVTLTGIASNTLSGTHAGQTFGATE